MSRVRNWVHSLNRAERLLLGAIILFFLSMILQVAIELQVQARNKRLDELETSIGQLTEDTEKIRVVADSVGESNEPSPELQEIFRKINEMYEVVVETTQTTE